MLNQAENLAVERSGYARLLRAWAKAQEKPEAKRALFRLADAQDEAVDVLLNIPRTRSSEHRLH